MIKMTDKHYKSELWNLAWQLCRLRWCLPTLPTLPTGRQAAGRREVGPKDGGGIIIFIFTKHHWIKIPANPNDP